MISAAGSCRLFFYNINGSSGNITEKTQNISLIPEEPSIF
jgi:hypothetical protein